MDNLINVVIIDDEFRAVELLESYCKKTSLINLCGGFTNPVEAIDFINTQKIDLIFTDINMNEISGISVAKMFLDKKFIFTTAYSEFAVEGFEMNAVDYLLKPIEYDRFLKACLKAQKELRLDKKNHTATNNLSESLKTIKIKSENSIYLLQSDDILFLEKYGNYMYFHTKENKISSRINMKDAFDLIDPSKFCRVHKSFIVAMDKIIKVEHNHIHIDTHKIPIGRSHKKDFFDRL